VQVDPIKPMLKAPATNRLKLKHGAPLSSFGFKFNLHLYILGTAACGAFEIPAQFTNFTKEITTTVWCYGSLNPNPKAYTLNPKP